MPLPTYKKQTSQVASSRQTAGGTSTASYQASAQVNQSLAQRLSSFSQQLHGMAGTMAQDQASKDAVRDIHTRKQKIADINTKYDEKAYSEFRPMTEEEYNNRNNEIAQVAEGTERKFSGIYSRAYNNTASAAYSNQIQADAKAASDQAMIAAQGDSEAYQMQMKAFRDSTIPNAPTPETAIVAELAINQYGSQGFKQLKMAEIKATEQRNFNSFKSNGEQQALDILKNMQEGNFVNGIENLFKYEQTLQSGVKEGWINKEDAQLAISETTEKGVLAYAKDRISMMEEVDAREFIQDFREGNVNNQIPEQFLEVDKEKVASRMEYLLDREVRKRDVANKTQEKQDFESVKDTIFMLDRGEILSDERLNKERNKNITPEVRESLDLAIKDNKLLRVFDTKNLTEQSDIIAELKNTTNKTADDLRLQYKYEKHLSQDLKAIKEDGLSYTFGKDKGFDEPLEAIDFSNEDSVSNRQKQVDLASTYTGVQQPFFTKSELDNLKLSIPNMTSKSKADLSATLNKLPEATKGATFSKLGGVFAVAGNHTVSNVSSHIFEGEELLKNKIVVPKRDIRTSIGVNIKEALGAASNENRADAIKAVEAYMAYQADLSGSDIDSVSEAEAIKAVMGEKIITGNWGWEDNKEVFPPFPDVTSDQFFEWKDNLKREDFAVDGVDMTLREADILKNGEFVFAGNGKYLIKIGNSKATYIDEKGEEQPYIVRYKR